MRCRECGEKIEFDNVSTEKGVIKFWRNNKVIAINQICKNCLEGE